MLASHVLHVSRLHSASHHRAAISCHVIRSSVGRARQLRSSRVLSRQQQVTCRSLWPSAKPEAQAHLSVGTVTTALVRAQNAWEQYDKGKKGELSMPEVVALLNSEEVRQAIRLITNVEPLPYTEALVQETFSRADKDKSGRLSRSEFLALYLSLASQRVKGNPLLLAEALLGIIDADRNGTIEGGELRVLLTLLGFPAALILPIPPFVKVDYRNILKAFKPSAK